MSNIVYFHHNGNYLKEKLQPSFVHEFTSEGDFMNATQEQTFDNEPTVVFYFEGDSLVYHPFCFIKMKSDDMNIFCIEPILSHIKGNIIVILKCPNAEMLFTDHLDNIDRTFGLRRKSKREMWGLIIKDEKDLEHITIESLNNMSALQNKLGYKQCAPLLGSKTNHTFTMVPKESYTLSAEYEGIKVESRLFKKDERIWCRLSCSEPIKVNGEDRLVFEIDGKETCRLCLRLQTDKIEAYHPVIDIFDIYGDSLEKLF